MLMNVKRQICVNTMEPASTAMVHMFVTVQMVGKGSTVKRVRLFKKKSFLYNVNAEKMRLNAENTHKCLSTITFLRFRSQQLFYLI